MFFLGLVFAWLVCLSVNSFTDKVMDELFAKLLQEEAMGQKAVRWILGSIWIREFYHFNCFRQ